MKPIIKIKIAVICEIINNFKNADSIIIIEYQKLKVTEFIKLRRELAKLNAYIKIYKNSLVNLAIKKIGFSKLNKFLTGPNAFIFGTKDQITILKNLEKFSKINPAVKLKAGIYEGKILNTKKIIEIAELPTKDELLLTFILNLLYPIHSFLTIIKKIAIIKKKNN